MALLPQMERAAELVHRLGPRVTLEVMLELGCRHDCVAEVAALLQTFARFSPEMIYVAGADRMIPRPLTLVPPA